MGHALAATDGDSEAVAGFAVLYTVAKKSA